MIMKSLVGSLLQFSQLDGFKLGHPPWSDVIKLFMSNLHRVGIS
jgi:hypothetical protein